MAQDDVFQVGVVTNVDGEATANVFHLTQSSVGSPDLEDAYQDISDLFTSEVVPDWQLRAGQEAVIECVKVQRISPTRDPAQILPYNVVGLLAQDCMPAINACVHSWYTAVATGRGRGRKFWSGLSRGSTEFNNLNVAGFNAEAAFALTFLSDWVGPDTYQAGIWSPTAAEFNKLEGVIVRVILKNIRSRKPISCV